MKIVQHRIILLISAMLATGVSFYTSTAWADVSSNGILDNVTVQFRTQAASWGGIITGYATRLFWALGTISLVWTGSGLIFKKADISEFFAEFIRFILFFGFFLWLLQNAAAIGAAIIDSMIAIGANASQTGASNPSAVMDIGFNIFYKVMDQTTISSPVDSIIGALLAGIILVCIALIAANMTIMLCSAWILLYGGIFFLGFGGSRWTSDIAINYYKAILSVAASLMAMILMIGIAQSIITNYYNQMGPGIRISEIATIMVVAIILLLLIHRIPGLISGILTGGTIGNTGIGSMGAGTAMGAMGVAAAAAGMGGAVAASAARNIATGGATVMAVMQAAGAMMAEGWSSNSNSTPSSGGLAEAMGNGNSAMAPMSKDTGSKSAGRSSRGSMPNSISAAHENNSDDSDDEITAFVHKNA